MVGRTELIVTLRLTQLLDEQLAFCKENHINNFRINMARGNIIKNKALFETLLECNPQANIFIDLPGTKYRIDSLSEKKFITANTYFILGSKNIQNIPLSVPFNNYEEYKHYFNVGDIIVFGDNNVKSKVVEVRKYGVILQSFSSGWIKSRAGITNISTYISNISISDSEISMIDIFDNEHVFWEISFADSIERIKACKKHIHHGKVIAKIESPAGVNNYRSFNKYIDGLMLARGDLSNFYDQSIINEKLFNELLEYSRFNNLVFIAASNYYRIMGEINSEDAFEKETLLSALRRSPDYIMLNETSYSQYWKEIISSYMNI